METTQAALISRLFLAEGKVRVSHCSLRLFFRDIKNKDGMTTIDWIIVIVLGLGALQGFRKGLVSQVASIVGLVAGLLVARALFGAVGERLAVEIGTSVTVGQILAFVLIGIAVPVGLSVAASLLTGILNAVSLGFVNRWLGSGLGLIRYALVVSMVIHLIDFVDTDNSLVRSTTRQESLLYNPMGRFADVFYPAVRSVAGELMNASRNLPDTEPADGRTDLDR